MGAKSLHLKCQPKLFPHCSSSNLTDQFTCENGLADSQLNREEPLGSWIKRLQNAMGSFRYGRNYSLGVRSPDSKAQQFEGFGRGGRETNWIDV